LRTFPVHACMTQSNAEKLAIVESQNDGTNTTRT
jgi:hypothetical protein